MTSTIGSSTARQLPGAPTRKCYRPYSGRPRRCDRPQNPSVDALELFGSHLALIDTFALRYAAGNGTTEGRTESIHGGPQRLVALMSIGEGGQTWIGPSWATGRLSFYTSCFGDSSGCVGAGGGAFAFDRRTNRYAQARSAAVLTGFAIDDDGVRAYEALGTGDDLRCDAAAAPCRLRRTDPQAFKPTRSQAREP